MPRHVVVDGSNIATEGRAMPSLRQLNEAVLAYMEEHPGDTITVVVDATFGHRIDPREVAEFDAAVENNELVSPPAGAIGRGDVFVLTIANKAGATILSNDSFQEFHADFAWLFDEGRLVGGKPVPNVGWVFVNRAPVRGPISRRATREAKKGTRRGEAKKATAKPSPLALEPMPTPKTPPPGRRRGGRKAAEAAEPADADVAEVQAAAAPPAPARHAEAPSGSKQSAINDLLPFLEFVELHPVGTLVEAEIESYSSHGAYATVDDVRCYLPLRFLAEPAPRSARDVVGLGERHPFVVVSFNPSRRGIDIAVPGLQPLEVQLQAAPEPATAKPAKSAKKAARSRKKATAAPEPEVEVLAATDAPAPTPAKKATRSRKKAAAAAEPEVEAPAATDAPVPAPTPAKKATRSRKKAAAAPEPEAVAVTEAPVLPEAPPAIPEAPAPTSTPAKRASRSRKKAAAAPAPAPSPEVAEPSAKPPRSRGAAKSAPAKKATRTRKKPAAS